MSSSISLSIFYGSMLLGKARTFLQWANQWPRGCWGKCDLYQFKARTFFLDESRMNITRKSLSISLASICLQMYFMLRRDTSNSVNGWFTAETISSRKVNSQLQTARKIERSSECSGNSHSSLPSFYFCAGLWVWQDGWTQARLSPNSSLTLHSPSRSL